MSANQPKSEAVNAQIEELTRLIALQQQKMASLENKLQEKDVKSTPPPPSQRRRRSPAIPDDVHVLEKFEIHTDYTIAFSKVMMISKTARAATPSDLMPIVVVVDTSGTLYLYDQMGQLITSASLGHAPGVGLTAVEVDSSDPQFPTVASAAKDGSVHVAAIRRVQKPKVRGVYEVSVAPTMTMNVIPVKKSSVGTDICVNDASSGQCTVIQPYVTAIALVVRARNGCFLYTGDSLGRVMKTLCHSGRQMSEITLPNADALKQPSPINSLVITRGSLAVTRDNSIFVIDSQKMSLINFDCELPATISDLRFDERLGSLMIAQADTGGLFFLTTAMSRPKDGSKTPTRVCAVMPLDNVNTSNEVITGLGSVKGYFLSVTDCELKIFNNSGTTRQALSSEHLETISYASKGCVPLSTRGFGRDHHSRSVTLGQNTKGALLHVYNQIPPASKGKGMLGAITSMASASVHSEALMSHILVSYNSFKKSSKLELNPFSLVSKVVQKKSVVHNEGTFNHGVVILYTSNLKFIRPTSPLTDLMSSGRIYLIIGIAVVVVFWKRIFGRSKGPIMGKSDRNNKYRNKQGRSKYEDRMSLDDDE